MTRMTRMTRMTAAARQHHQRSTAGKLSCVAVASIRNAATPLWARVRNAHQQWRHATLTQLARVVCPEAPVATTPDELAAHTATSALGLIDALPRPLQWGLSLGLAAYDGSALPRHHQPARRLPPSQATLHFQRWTSAPRPLRTITKAISTPVVQLLVLAYYEQPAVCAALGYDADTYIAQQRRGRLVQHRTAIADRARTVLAADPLRPTPPPKAASSDEPSTRGRAIEASAPGERR